METGDPLQLRKAKLEEDLERAMQKLRACPLICLNDYILADTLPSATPRAPARARRSPHKSKGPLYVSRPLAPSPGRKAAAPIITYGKAGDRL